jgi:hypothetical protein
MKLKVLTGLFIAAGLVLVLSVPTGTRAGGLDPDFMLSAGPRYGEFDWNIAAADGSPNILSELTWNKLNIYQIKGMAWTPLSRSFYIRGSFNYGWIYDGENQDSDYNGNNRSLEYSRSNNKTDSGDVWDASAGLGYIFFDGPLKAASLLGYSYHMQNLTLTEGFQTVCTATCTTGVGPFGGLDSTYDALWYGPWVGLELMYRSTGKKLTLNGVFEYHIARYEAQANWNLRSDFQHPVSFEHSGDGQGVIASTGLDYALDGQWSVNGEVMVERWTVADGIDLIFNSNGTTSSTQLNEVNWYSTALMIGVKYRY